MAKGPNDKDRAPGPRVNTDYPFCQSTVTECGHEITYDNTPGHERIRIAHCKGTYDEVCFDGRHVSITVGNKQEYNKSGKTETTDHNSDVKISGHERKLVGGGSHSEVAGDSHSVTGGDTLVIVNGAAKFAVAGDIMMNSKGKINFNGAGGINMSSGGPINIKGSGGVNVQGGDINLNTPGAADGADESTPMS